MSDLQQQANRTLTDSGNGNASEPERPVCRACGSPAHATKPGICAKGHAMRGNRLAASRDEDPHAGTPISTPAEAVARLEDHQSRLLAKPLNARTLHALTLTQKALKEMRATAGEGSGESTRMGGKVARIIPTPALTALEAHLQTHLAMGVSLDDVPQMSSAAFVKACAQAADQGELADVIAAIVPDPLRIEVTHACYRCKGSDPQYQQATTREQPASAPRQEAPPQPAAIDYSAFGQQVGPALVKGNKPAVAPPVTSEKPAKAKRDNLPFQVVGNTKVVLHPGDLADPRYEVHNDKGQFPIRYRGESPVSFAFVHVNSDLI